jgi:nitrogen fixation protein NifU and related proteins
MNMLDDLYQEVLLEHKKRPRNCGRLQCDHRCAAGHNPLCGDSISVQLAESGDVLSDIAFEGQGCAICIASASLMTEAVKGRPLAEVRQLSAAMHDLLTRDTPLDDAEQSRLGKLAALQGVRRFPSRIKCAMLGWCALDECLKGATVTSTPAKEMSHANVST